MTGLVSGSLLQTRLMIEIFCCHRNGLVLLASIACHLIHGSVEAARDRYRTVRTELAEYAPRRYWIPARRPAYARLWRQGGLRWW